MKQVAIIDYGSGNLRSAAKAFEHAGGPDIKVSVSDDPTMLAHASHIVLPGVGAFADCMRGLDAVPGMHAALEEEVLKKGKPFLGICVGMQMLFAKGHEHGTHEGLGWIEGEVVKLESRVASRDSDHATRITPLKIPHMGWNELQLSKPDHPLLAGIHPDAHSYFVHSYHAQCAAKHILATVDYGGPVTAIVAKGNIMGTQFHPEKSQETGLKLIENFLKL